MPSKVMSGRDMEFLRDLLLGRRVSRTLGKVKGEL